jgi:hypothetical protein
VPVPPSSWFPNNPVTAQQLNNDLYSYDGSVFGVNGVAFFANRPALLETLKIQPTLSAPSGGQWNVLPTGQTVVAVFTTSGSWQAPNGVTSVFAECWGGGGGGGSPGTGGGAGEYAAEQALAVTQFTTYSYTVGGFGLGAVSGGAGSDGTPTIFPGAAGTVTAHAGHGGSASTSGPGGPGGSGSGNSIHSDGGAGGFQPNTGLGIDSGAGGGGAGGNGSPGFPGSWTIYSSIGGSGGLGQAGGGSGGNGAAVGGVPTVGGFPGGGGGGGYVDTPDGVGASGNNGMIRLTYFIPGAQAGNTLLDSGALFGEPSDNPGKYAFYAPFSVGTHGSSGAAGSLAGGWVLLIHFITCGPFSGTSCAVGAGWSYDGSTIFSAGTLQEGSATFNNCAYVASFVDTTGLTNPFIPAIFCSDPSSANKAIVSNTSNTNGFTPRLMQVWAGVTDNGTTVTSIPTPQASWTSASTVSSTGLTGTIQNTLNLLNYPPMFGISQVITQSIGTTNTVTAFTGTPGVDSYNSFNAGSSTVTIKLPGIYFCHARLNWAGAQTTGTRLAGFVVNGTYIYGGAYPANPVGNGTGVSITRVLDLQAGDTVQVFGLSSVSTSLNSTGSADRWEIVWLCASGATPVSGLTPPDVYGFRFAAGTSSILLPSLFQSKLGNDLNFILYRPYLTVYQSVAQTGLSNNTFHSITMDKVQGPIHGTVGDNYGGWNAGSNHYAAPVAGWYLTVSEISMAVQTSGTMSLGASIYNPASGGVSLPGGVPDTYQQMVPVLSGTNPTAACAIGMYYLLPGESVQPNAFVLGGASTWATSVTNFNSHFSVIWICE